MARDSSTIEVKDSVKCMYFSKLFFKLTKLYNNLNNLFFKLSIFILCQNQCVDFIYLIYISYTVCIDFKLYGQ